MPTYIMLMNWTDQGIKTVKDVGKRTTAYKKLIAEHGGKVKSFHMTMGAYDLVAISELPDDESVARAMLTLGQRGNVHTTTLKSFPEAEMRKIIASLD